jgi:hypothetical protein
LISVTFWSFFPKKYISGTFLSFFPPQKNTFLVTLQNTQTPSLPVRPLETSNQLLYSKDIIIIPQTDRPSNEDPHPLPPPVPAGSEN